MKTVLSSFQDVSEPSDLELMESFVDEKNRLAVDALYSRHFSTAVRVARVQLGRSADAEDVVHTAFVKLISSAENTAKSRREHISVAGLTLYPASTTPDFASDIPSRVVVAESSFSYQRCFGERSAHDNTPPEAAGIASYG